MNRKAASEESSGGSTQTSRVVGIGLGAWLLTAITTGASGLFYGLPTPIIGSINGGLVTLMLLLVYFTPSLRTWVMEVPLQWLVSYHAVRFVGIAFLALHAVGTIPSEFALIAGWGDIAVATTALVVAFVVLPVRKRASWWLLLLWNAFGLLDILVVLRTGIGLGLSDAAQMTWITAFPMSLLPTFIVPLVIVTHLVIFARLWRLRSLR